MADARILFTLIVFDLSKVDEGIEAMLCCWLQQLQEFGGPEVEKPDLLKGSIGSLKNLGLTNAATAAPAFKAASNSGSLSKHKNMLDMRARYNVSTFCSPYKTGKCGHRHPT